MTSSADPTFPKVVRPQGDEVPVVMSCPHSGTVIPEVERSLYSMDVERIHKDGDLFVDELYAGSEALGATFVSTPYSRFVIDLNRLPDDLSPRSVRGTTERRAPGYYGQRGLIWAVSTRGAPIYDQPLPRSVFERRFRQYYEPYHRTLRSELDRLRDRFGFAVLLDGHSMPSRATRLHSDPGGTRRADIVPGDLKGKSCHRWLSQLTLEVWESAGYVVAPNSPYRGGGITRRYGDPRRGIHAIQIELNRKLYMDEQALERSEGFDQLREHCLAYVEAVAEETRRRM